MRRYTGNSNRNSQSGRNAKVAARKAFDQEKAGWRSSKDRFNSLCGPVTVRYVEPRPKKSTRGPGANYNPKLAKSPNG